MSAECHNHLFALNRYLFDDPCPDGVNRAAQYLPNRLVKYDTQFNTAVINNDWASLSQSAWPNAFLNDIRAIHSEWTTKVVPKTICPTTFPQSKASNVQTAVLSAVNAVLARVQAYPHVWNAAPGSEQGRFVDLFSLPQSQALSIMWFSARDFYLQYGRIGEDSNLNTYTTPAFGVANAYQGHMENVSPLGLRLRNQLQDMASLASATMYEYWGVTNACCNEFVDANTSWPGGGSPDYPPDEDPNGPEI